MVTEIVIGIIVLAVIVLAVIGYVYSRRQRSKELRERFGPEYQETVQAVGNRSRAEKMLEGRVKRVEAIDVHPLQPEATRSFSAWWNDVQARFVDDPRGAVADADRLVQRVMSERGYPVGDFDQRAADISVDHPEVVSNYRDAHAAYLASQAGEVGTDRLREAFVHYRALFDELLQPAPSTTNSRQQPA